MKESVRLNDRIECKPSLVRFLGCAGFLGSAGYGPVELSLALAAGQDLHHCSEAAKPHAIAVAKIAPAAVTYVFFVHIGAVGRAAIFNGDSAACNINDEGCVFGRGRRVGKRQVHLFTGVRSTDGHTSPVQRPELALWIGLVGHNKTANRVGRQIRWYHRRRFIRKRGLTWGASRRVRLSSLRSWCWRVRALLSHRWLRRRWRRHVHGRSWLWRRVGGAIILLRHALLHWRLLHRGLWIRRLLRVHRLAILIVLRLLRHRLHGLPVLIVLGLTRHARHGLPLHRVLRLLRHRIVRIGLHTLSALLRVVGLLPRRRIAWIHRLLAWAWLAGAWLPWIGLAGLRIRLTIRRIPALPTAVLTIVAHRLNSWLIAFKFHKLKCDWMSKRTVTRPRINLVSLNAARGSVLLRVVGHG
jgi:hypothetical protein